VTLRTLALLDALQPGTAAFFGTVCNGQPPLAGDASLIVEVAPAMNVHQLLDDIAKQTRCVAGWLVVEREFGVLEVHARDLAEVKAAEALVRERGSPARPQLTALQRITGIDPQHAQVIDRLRHGDMLLPGQTLLIAETQPAGYALLAANEAEKSADIHILEVLAFGASGRLWLGGDDAPMRVAEAVVRSTLSG
jgi:hypothetical protein